jgi:hypothetical protein
LGSIVIFFPATSALQHPVEAFCNTRTGLMVPTGLLSDLVIGMFHASRVDGGIQRFLFNINHSQETTMKLLSVIALVMFTSVSAFANDAAAPAAAPAGEAAAAPAAEAPAAPAEKAGKKAKKAKRVRKQKKAH